MSETNLSGHYQAFELTEQGMALRQLTVAGEKDGKKYTVEFTRGAIGQGRPDKDDDIFYLTDLIDRAADVPIKETYAVSINHHMSIVISNSDLKEDVLMTEIGIFARLLDAETKQEVMSEMLYGYTYTQKYDYIPAAKTYFVYREIKFNTVLSRSGKFEIVFDGSKVFVTLRDFQEFMEYLKSDAGASLIGYDNSKTKLNAENVQHALDEITLLNPIECIIEHNLDTYPQVMVLEVEHGCGYGGCSDVPCGGNPSREVRSLAVFDDRNRLQLRILKNLSGEPEMERVSRNEFILKYPDTSLSVILFEGYTITPGIGETKLSGTLDLMSELAVRQLVSDEVARLTTSINVSKRGADKAVTELRTGLTGLNTTVTNNKAESSNSINKLNTTLLSLNTNVSKNKMEADSSINGLSASISELGTTVTSNKETVDKALNSLETSLGKNIAAVPVGCGN